MIKQDHPHFLVLGLTSICTNNITATLTNTNHKDQQPLIYIVIGANIKLLINLKKVMTKHLALMKNTNKSTCK